MEHNKYHSAAPLVSIVTPFYNTAAHLEECIKSVLCQSHSNWEYILIDNCSSDGSSEIADCYSKRYPNKIRVHRNPSFLSQVQNYNAALRTICADSTYCKIVQADDWLFRDCIRSMVEVAESHPTVGIVSAYELEGDEVRLDGLPYPSPKVCGRDVCRLYFLRAKYLFGTPTSLLFRSELIRSRDPFYDEQYAPFEDGHACFDLLTRWDFGFVHQVLTYSRRDNDSIISRLRPFGLELFLQFSLLVAHGRKFLTEDEYNRCFRKLERQYFLFLSKYACARKRAGDQFWEFHRNGLAAVNYPLTWWRLAKWAPRAIGEKLWSTAWSRWDSEQQ